jgi:hypothetical protein
MDTGANIPKDENKIAIGYPSSNISKAIELVLVFVFESQHLLHLL